MPGELDEKLESSTSNPTTTPEGAPADNEQVPAAKPEERVEPSTPAEAAPKEPAKESPPKPAPKEAKPDPVQQAIAKLAKPETAKPAAKPAPQKSEAATPKADAGDEEPKAVDPLEGFSETERKALNQKTEARIRQLHKEAKEAREALGKGGEIANPLHKEMVTILDEPEVKGDVQFVHRDELKDLIAVQSAVNRSAIAVRQGRRPAAQDVETLRVAHEWMVGKVAGLAGIQPKAAPSAELLPFDGKLPQEYQDLVDIHGLAEADVRLLAALKQRQAAPPKAPPQEAPQREATVPASAPEGVDMAAIYHDRLISTFESDGVGRGRGEAYRISLAPAVLGLVQTKFPGTTKEDARSIFAALPVEDKFSFYLQAHNRVKASSSRPANPTPPPPTRAPVSGGTPRSVGSAPSDPVEAAIARLARPE